MVAVGFSRGAAGVIQAEEWEKPEATAYGRCALKLRRRVQLVPYLKLYGARGSYHHISRS